MNTKKWLVILVASAGLLGVSASGAQSDTQNSGSQEWGPGGAHGRMYNPQTVETIHGQVVEVENSTRRKGMGPGVHLLLKTDSETIPVHLGPKWFLDHQEVQIKPKDKVEITGSRVTFDGKPAIVAAEVRKGDNVLRLRSEDGHPVWAASMPGMMGREPGMMGRRPGMMMGPGGGMMMGPGRGMMMCRGCGMMRPGMMWGGPMRGRMMRNRMMRGRMMQGGMMGGGMVRGPGRMMEEHKQMMGRLKSMQLDLDKSVARMNEAKGDAKIKAMESVIDKLVAQRREMLDHMTAMQDRMMSRMGRMGGMGDTMGQPGGNVPGRPSPQRP